MPSASALSSGSPKSPRVRQGPKTDSTEADRGAPAAAYGARNRAGSSQAHHPPQSPSLAAPRAPQRQVGSIPFAAATAPRGHSPPPCSPRLLPQSAAPGPASRAPASGPHHSAVGPSPPLPSSGVTTVPAPTAPSSAAANRRTSWSPHDGFCSSSTPSRARAHTPSPPPGSSSSSASSSRPPHMSCDSDTSSVRSYASVLKGPANQIPYAKLSQGLLKFLEYEFTINTEKIVSMTVNFNLVIVFEHLLEYDKELAYAIFNCQDRFHEWVNPTASEFLTSKGIAKNVDGIVKVTFSGMPRSIKPLEDFLREQGSLIRIRSIFGGSFELCVARDIGMMLVHGFLEKIFNDHRKDLTWNGGFNISDMVVVNSTECRIIKKSTRGGSHCRAKDLHKIGELFMPRFSCNRGMALYFDVLQKDLSMASENEVKEKWFWEYLLSHPALKGSMERSYLECGLQKAAVTVGVNGMLRSVLEGCSCSDWKALIPVELTKNTLVADVSLYKVFWFKRERTSFYETGGAMPLKREHTEGADPFTNTLGGLLAYKRNFLQHGHEYLMVQDHTELEQFAAKTFPRALPDILRNLLRHCKMHVNEVSMGHWEPYRASKGWQQ